MFSLSRLQAIVLVLIASVLVGGFMLADDFVQEAAAHYTQGDCDAANDACDLAIEVAWIVCTTHGSGSPQCDKEQRRAGGLCAYAAEVCANISGG
ncbi:hypothetical protein C6502_17790 [Candidatus Poribacteria bacterium]|nr:MAG: hypothetical protein C6502_17790 [Candidatus Poribacteria bacterium]